MDNDDQRKVLHNDQSTRDSGTKLEIQMIASQDENSGVDKASDLGSNEVLSSDEEKKLPVIELKDIHSCDATSQERSNEVRVKRDDFTTASTHNGPNNKSNQPDSHLLSEEHPRTHICDVPNEDTCKVTDQMGVTNQQ